MRQVFIADDGREFSSSEECDQYERMAEVRAKIQAWAQANFTKKGQATKIYNHATAWEAARDQVLGS